MLKATLCGLVAGSLLASVSHAATFEEAAKVALTGREDTDWVEVIDETECRVRYRPEARYAGIQSFSFNDLDWSNIREPEKDMGDLLIPHIAPEWFLLNPIEEVLVVPNISKDRNLTIYLRTSDMRNQTIFTRMARAVRYIYANFCDMPEPRPF